MNDSGVPLTIQKQNEFLQKEPRKEKKEAEEEERESRWLESALFLVSSEHTRVVSAQGQFPATPRCFEISATRWVIKSQYVDTNIHEI